MIVLLHFCISAHEDHQLDVPIPYHVHGMDGRGMSIGINLGVRSIILWLWLRLWDLGVILSPEMCYFGLFRSGSPTFDRSGVLMGMYRIGVDDCPSDVCKMVVYVGSFYVEMTIGGVGWVYGSCGKVTGGGLFIGCLSYCLGRENILLKSLGCSILAMGTFHCCNLSILECDAFFPVEV